MDFVDGSGRLGHDAVWQGAQLPTLRRTVARSSSGSNQTVQQTSCLPRLRNAEDEDATIYRHSARSQAATQRHATSQAATQRHATSHEI